MTTPTPTPTPAHTVIETLKNGLIRFTVPGDSYIYSCYPDRLAVLCRSRDERTEAREYDARAPRPVYSAEVERMQRSADRDAELVD